MLTSNETCVTGSPAVSDTIIIAVIPVNPVSVTVNVSANPACEGSTVTFTANPVNGGPVPAFQWMVDLTDIPGQTNNTFDFIPANGQVIQCRLTSAITCPSGNPAISPPVTMTVLPLTVSYSACHDVITTPYAKPFRLKGGLPLQGTYSGPGVIPGTDMFDPALANPGSNTITYSYTTSDGCSDSRQVTIDNQPGVPVDCSSPVMTDIRDNREYPIVQIGSQCWMAANLNYGIRGNLGSAQTDNCQVEKYCLNDQETNCNLYGALYQWDELMRYEPGLPGRQGLCPPGWHVPSEGEWSDMVDSFGGKSLAADSLKLSGAGHFQAKTGGLMYQNTMYSFATSGVSATAYWTSDAAGTRKAVAHGLTEQTGSVSDYHSGRENGFAVRCIRD